jgi:uncharacterized protein
MSPVREFGATAMSSPPGWSHKVEGLRNHEAPARRRTDMKNTKGDIMGQPVVHFEVIGKDGAALQSFYADLFGWKIDTDNPMNYGVVHGDGGEGTGIGGGIGTGPEGYPGHVTFYIGVPDVEAALAKAEGLGGSRVMGPEKVMEEIEIGLFNDPEGHLIGVVKTS